MKNLNAEQIKKELAMFIEDMPTELHFGFKRTIKFREFLKEALALITSQEQSIKELTEENERLSGAVKQYEEERKYHFEMSRTRISESKADTVRKMQTAIKEYYSKSCYRPTKEHPVKHTQIEHLFYVVDQIAKEMLGAEK